MSDSLPLDGATCSACTSGALFGPARLYPETGMGEGNVLVATARSRNFSTTTASAIRVWTCRNCGHLEFFAADPEGFYEQWAAENDRS